MLTPGNQQVDSGRNGIADVLMRVRSLHREWMGLRARYLPVTPGESKWSYNREWNSRDAEQGWKLHVSATALTASETLRRVTPFLLRTGVLFKAPVTLEELRRINSGRYYGYSQVGKFMTVYPRSDREAIRIARRLHALTLGMTAPMVPFDQRFRPESCVYYRYGAFVHREMAQADGALVPAIRDPEGKLVPDLRQGALPAWALDPLADKRRRRQRIIDSPLRTTFRAFRALSQRGKGGVYQAVDLSAGPPRLCIVKEGRAGGEVGWDGRDGHWRVKNEERVLRALRDRGIAVPLVYSSFVVEDNYYLVTEFVEGDTLQSLLDRKQRRLPVQQALLYGLDLSRIISGIHSAGWIWRDCKPGNLIVTKSGEMRPLDFEGACRLDQLDAFDWCTPEFAPPECEGSNSAHSSAANDVYALGAIVYFLLTGRLPLQSNPVAISKLRRVVPPSAGRAIEELLDPDPDKRPSIQSATAILEAALGFFSQGARLTFPRSSANLGSSRIGSNSGSILM
jgi:hypothetical protein